jgi:hypothetical protein
LCGEISIADCGLQIADFDDCGFVIEIVDCGFAQQSSIINPQISIRNLNPQSTI